MSGSGERFFWETVRLEQAADSGAGEGPPGPLGQHLAALRRGLGKEPGTVPAMWPYYTQLNEAGTLTRELLAEHLCLSLYGFHQQSRRRPVHHPEHPGLGGAIAAVAASSRYGEAAVWARFMAAATASTFEELSGHLRRLVALMKTVPDHPGMNYTRLFRDLVDWQSLSSVGRVRRRWGGEYLSCLEREARRPEKAS